MILYILGKGISLLTNKRLNHETYRRSCIESGRELSDLAEDSEEHTTVCSTARTFSSRRRPVVKHSPREGVRSGEKMAETTCPVFHPTEHEFLNFRRYIEEVVDPIAGKVGLCKVVPPPGPSSFSRPGGGRNRCHVYEIDTPTEPVYHRL